jgi:hypothetical protein
VSEMARTPSSPHSSASAVATTQPPTSNAVRRTLPASSAGRWRR